MFWLIEDWKKGFYVTNSCRSNRCMQSYVKRTPYNKRFVIDFFGHCIGKIGQNSICPLSFWCAPAPMHTITHNKNINLHTLPDNISEIKSKLKLFVHLLFPHFWNCGLPSPTVTIRRPEILIWLIILIDCLRNIFLGNTDRGYGKRDHNVQRLTPPPPKRPLDVICSHDLIPTVPKG